MTTDRTGWPAGLMQDDSSELSKWFASKPDARYVAACNAARIRQEVFERTLKPWRVYRIKDTGQHCELVGFFQDFTVSVYVTGHDNPALWPLQASSRPLCVFGLHPRDLERIQPSEAFRK